MRVRVPTAACLAACGLALAVAGCGAPGGESVASVGGTDIPRASFDRWLRTTSIGQRFNGDTVVPDPPDYRRCVEQTRILAVVQGQPRNSLGGGRVQRRPATAGGPEPAELRRRCRAEYEQLRGEVMRFLVGAEWIRQASDDAGIHVSEAQVTRALDEQRRRAFADDAAYRRALASAGLTESQARFRVRLDLLQDALIARARKEAGGSPQARERALDELARRLRRDYRSKTTCADDFLVSDCDNGPSPPA
jgi:SurA-like protein